MKTIKAIRVTTLTVIDPDTNAPVNVVIAKLETGGIVGIDESFLANTEESVYSPFDKNVKIDVDNL